MGSDHPQGTHYAITGHEVNPAMHFPSLGSIVCAEAKDGPQSELPSYVALNGGGYGPAPGRRNPYAAGAVPFINMDYNDLLQTPPNNSGSQQPNDCDFLFKKANEEGTPQIWKLFNDCAHNR